MEEKIYEDCLYAAGLMFARKRKCSAESAKKKHLGAKLTIVGTSPNVTVENVKVVGRIPMNEMENIANRHSSFGFQQR